MGTEKEINGRRTPCQVRTLKKYIYLYIKKTSVQFNMCKYIQISNQEYNHWMLLELKNIYCTLKKQKSLLESHFLIV